MTTGVVCIFHHLSVTIVKLLHRYLTDMWRLNTPIHLKEILFAKVNDCSEKDIAELFRISKVFVVTIFDYDGSAILLECTPTENKNDDLIARNTNS